MGDGRVFWDAMLWSWLYFKLPVCLFRHTRHTSVIYEKAHAVPGIFVREGGGGPVQSDKKALTTLFFSPQLILQKSNGQFKRNLSFLKVPEGVQHFAGEGGPTFSGGGGGSNCLFPIETHIT